MSIADSRRDGNKPVRSGAIPWSAESSMDHGGAPHDRPVSRVVLGITGASGICYGTRALELLRKAGVETHLVVTPAGQQTRRYETHMSPPELAAMADVAYRPTDVGAAIASGSFRTAGMLVAPCSVRTLSAIAYCAGDNLLTRAADVTLKERRRLVLMVRETPLTLGHLRAMSAVTEMGAIVMPPVPAFYLRPQTIDELIDHTVGRALDLLGIDVPDLPRWGENDERSAGRDEPHPKPA